jgi:hypothetical protein
VKTDKTDTTAKMTNIKGAFDNISRDTLLETMMRYKLPSAALGWAICE